MSGPLDALQKKKKLKEILKESVPVDLDNIVGFDRLTSEVYAEFANVEQVTGVKVSSWWFTFFFFLQWNRMVLKTFQGRCMKGNQVNNHLARIVHLCIFKLNKGCQKLKTSNLFKISASYASKKYIP